MHVVHGSPAKDSPILLHQELGKVPRNWAGVTACGLQGTPDCVQSIMFGSMLCQIEQRH